MDGNFVCRMHHTNSLSSASGAHPATRAATARCHPSRPGTCTPRPGTSCFSPPPRARPTMTCRPARHRHQRLPSGKCGPGAGGCPPARVPPSVGERSAGRSFRPASGIRLRQPGQWRSTPNPRPACHHTAWRCATRSRPRRSDRCVMLRARRASSGRGGRGCRGAPRG